MAEPVNVTKEPGERPDGLLRLVALAPWIGLAALATLAAGVGFRPIEDGDLFWNLAIGRWVLAHHQLLPAIDPFTYNAGSAPVQHEWLAQVLLARIADFGGLASLRIFGGIWSAAVVCVAFFALRRRGAGELVALAGASLWWLFAAPHAVVRPHLLAWLPAWITIGWLLGSDPLHRSAPRMLLGMGVVVLWGNLHASVLLAPFWCGAMLATTYVVAWRNGQPLWGSATRIWLVHLCWTTLASLLQSASWHLLPYALHTPAVNRALSNEWWPLLSADVWAARPHLIIAWTGLAAAVVISLIAAWRRAIWPPRAPGPLLAVFAVVHAALTRRMTAFLLLPIIWLVDRIALQRVPWRTTRFAALIIILLSLSSAAREARGYRQAGPLRTGAFPVAATAFVVASGLKGRPVHPDGWGGYLSWRAPGQFQVYADGRWPLVGTQVIADGVAMLTRQRDAGPLFAAYRADWLLQPAQLYLRVPPPNPEQWRLIWQDQQSVILLRRGGELFTTNVKAVCAFYAAHQNLVKHAAWPMRGRGPPGVAVPTDVQSITPHCTEINP